MAAYCRVDNLGADCLYTGISSKPKAQSSVTSIRSLYLVTLLEYLTLIIFQLQLLDTVQTKCDKKDIWEIIGKKYRHAAAPSNITPANRCDYITRWIEEMQFEQSSKHSECQAEQRQSHVNKYRIKWKCDINNDRKYNGVGRKQALEKHDFKTTGNNEQWEN